MPVRNPYACHPIMRKGGVHQQSKSSRRSRDRLSLLDEVDDYFLYAQTDIGNDIEQEETGKEPLAPSSFIERAKTAPLADVVFIKFN